MRVRVLVLLIAILRTLLRTSLRAMALPISVVHLSRPVGNVGLPDARNGFFDLGHVNTDFSHFQGYIKNVDSNPYSFWSFLTTKGEASESVHFNQNSMFV